MLLLRLEVETLPNGNVLEKLQIFLRFERKKTGFSRLVTCKSVAIQGRNGVVMPTVGD